MKQLTILAFCLFATGTMFAQNNTAKPKSTATPAGAAKGTKAKKKQGPAIAGDIRDGHRHAIADVQAFLYGKDSSIAASGYTDAMGHYETNAVLPGSYTAKFVYPGAKYIMVTGVEIKKDITPLNISADAPTSDTSYAYTALMPPPPEKEKKGHGTGKKK